MHVKLLFDEYFLDVCFNAADGIGAKTTTGQCLIPETTAVFQS